uniref:UPAR/Ly6 domain-containing protein n=1 Tax=Panagrolaimus sp. PS1159 TaxID=55785 RepID=A0AC35G9Q4_9BILA
MVKVVLIFVILASFFAVVESINCVSAENGVIKDGNFSCPSIDTLCVTVTLKYDEQSSGLLYINKRQGCENATTWTVNGIVNKCNIAGNLTFEKDLGSASCCDKNLCNNDTPFFVYNSAAKNYSFIGFFVFLVSVSFFLA